MNKLILLMIFALLSLPSFAAVSKSRLLDLTVVYGDKQSHFVVSEKPSPKIDFTSNQGEKLAAKIKTADVDHLFSLVGENTAKKQTSECGRRYYIVKTTGSDGKTSQSIVCMAGAEPAAKSLAKLSDLLSTAVKLGQAR
jgi:hypothetical protein